MSKTIFEMLFRFRTYLRYGMKMMNAPKSGSELQSSLKSSSGDMKAQMDQLKIEANEVKSSFLKTKHESQEVFKTLGDEVKTMISNYKADISWKIPAMAMLQHEKYKGQISNHQTMLVHHHHAHMADQIPFDRIRRPHRAGQFLDLPDIMEDDAAVEQAAVQ